MRMEAKFPGRCAKCSGAIQKGQTIWYENRKAFHPDCTTAQEPDNQQRGPDAYRLADELKYRHYDWNELE